MGYSKGKISIPNVTGNIVITVSAAPQARINLFDKNDTGVVLRARINSSGSAVDYADGQLVTGFIPCVRGNVITLETDKANNVNIQTGYIAVYSSDKTFLGHAINNAQTWWAWSSDHKKGVCNTTDVPATVFPENTAYIRLCAAYTDIDSIEVYVE